MYNKVAWENYTEEEVSSVYQFNEGYKNYLTKAKTERLAVKEAVALAEKAGFRNIKQCESLKSGDKVYVINKEKNFAGFVLGEHPMEDGMRILGAHIDSPRIDAKQNAIYESDGFVFMDTHYYGGIKKYQWVTTPLAIHGVVCLKSGKKVEIHIGEEETDPIVGISDLLIHLSQDQLQKTGSKVVEGEDLDVTLGTRTKNDVEKDKVKSFLMTMLKGKYGIEEEDFISAELEIVPAGKARDYGLDRSMVAGYGHDDRVCAYTSLMALLDSQVAPYTQCVILTDKEEVGSIGATGAHSKFFENTVAELLALTGKDSNLAVRHALENSKMLSSDVSAAFDPLYSSVFEKRNAAYFGKGICFNKYTGSRGKSGANDAMPEFFAEIRQALDSRNVYFQTAELGRVDQGGGGTISYILGNYNMYIIDAGIAVLNMHAPMEIVSKADVYEAYRAYRAFIELV